MGAEEYFGLDFPAAVVVAAAAVEYSGSEAAAASPAVSPTFGKRDGAKGGMRRRLEKYR